MQFSQAQSFAEIHFLQKTYHGSVSCSQVGDIEGDDVDLEYTQADVVRGRRVRIGEGCSIGRVEYSESLDAWDGTVGESVCTGEGAQ